MSNKDGTETWTRKPGHKPRENQLAGWETVKSEQSPVVVIIGKSPLPGTY